MSSVLAQFIEKEQQLKRLQEQMEKLKSNPSLQIELEFKERLIDLMAEYNKSEKDVLNLLVRKDESFSLGGKMRKQRKIKIYRNPETGDVVETRGGNHKTLKIWKEQYGSDTVESWIVKEGI